MRTNIASFEQSISSGVTICRVRPINRYRPINRIGKSWKSLYRIGIRSADYKGPYRLIGMGIKRAQIWANLSPSKRFEPLKYFGSCLETFEL